MSKLKTFIAFFVALGFVYSCGDATKKEAAISEESAQVEQDLNTDFLIFGAYFGYCVGDDCVKIYKVQVNAIYEDVLAEKVHGHTMYSGDFNHKINVDNKLYFAMLQELPELLLQGESGGAYGCPDCADQGGYYIEFKKDSVHKKYYLDTAIRSLPEEIQPFTTQIEAKINKLQRN